MPLLEKSKRKFIVVIAMEPNGAGFILMNTTLATIM